MSRGFEYEQKIDELNKECDGLKEAYANLIAERDYLQKALCDACEIIVENGVERGFCMLPKQGHCRDCPLGDSYCDVAHNWYKYFLENARHSQE
ncbi:MAG: host-nuclease inhibitor Gam family protein [Lachnospiraceae bacterium]|nr:host-nuclease inhibitor Gam family protein [Lachnospiraceae bacterium]